MALGTQPLGCFAVEAERPGLDHHAIFLTGELDRGEFVEHVRKDEFGIAFERVSVTAGILSCPLITEPRNS